ncbi:YbhB/YbcL family Raf kinase inhibitor-like protein [Candidatus Woesearchaeota archaeon]|nr:YbhB/YbcL family Raf kinase inhibitor-like protein [Candidatus Woesearchaeota archaeon]
MQIRATAFNNKENIPDKYTCDGEDINPALKIEQIPTNTKSLVLIVEDPDAQGGNWTHWLVYNIEPNKIIGENTAPGTQGLNSWGINRYRGPCPPTKTKHRYYFNIYALDTTLNLAPGSRKQEVIDAMQNHIIDEGALLGYYER